MAKKPLTPEMKALHKKLWPANIVICIVSLVAAVCLILMPWFDLRININGSKLATAITETMESESDSSIDEDAKSSISNMLDDVNIEVPINIYPMKLLNAGLGGEKELEDFFNGLIGKDGTDKYVDYLAEELVPSVMNAAAKELIEPTIEDAVKDALSTSELTPDQQTKVDGYVAKAEDVIDILLGGNGVESNPTLAKAKFDELLSEASADDWGQSGALLDQETVDEINAIFDDIVTAGTNPDSQKFDIVYAINNIGDVISSVSGTDASEFEDVQEIIDTIKSPGAMLVGEMDEDTQGIVRIVLIGVFGLFIAFPMFWWLHLALCALARIFTKRKRVKMWYVKFFCFWAGFFVLLFNVAFMMLPKIYELVDIEVTGVTAMLEAFSIKFLGSGVVTGICWLTLVLLGWFFYNRVKKRIKRLKKAEKKAAAQGLTAREYLVKQYSLKAIGMKMDPEEYFDKKKAKKYGLNKKAAKKVVAAPVETVAPVEEVQAMPVAEETPVVTAKEEVKAEEAFAADPVAAPVVEETPVVAAKEEVKAEETPVVAPVEEVVAPVEEAQAEEKPVAKPAAKKPAAKKPAAKTTTAKTTTAKTTTAKTTTAKTTAAKTTGTKSATKAAGSVVKPAAKPVAKTTKTTTEPTVDRTAPRATKKAPVREAAKTTKTTPKK